MSGCGQEDGGLDGKPSTPLASVTVDSDGACVIDAEGILWCWGEASAMFPGQPAYMGEENDCAAPFVPGRKAGVFGDCVSPGPMRPRFATEELAGTKVVSVSVAAPSPVAMLDGDGKVWYPGPGVHTSTSPAFEVVSGDHVFAQIDAGGTGWCGVTVAGEGYCYMAGNATEPLLLPIPGGHRFVRISTGTQFVALDETGAAWQGGFVQRVGTSPAEFIPSDPVQIEPGSQFVDAQAATSLAAFHSTDPVEAFVCLLDAAGSIVCRGFNNYGRLGLGMFAATATRSVVPGIVATAIAVGDSHVCALAQDGSVWCWGSNGSGELGAAVGSTCDLGGGVSIPCSAQPVQVVDLPPAVKIWAGNDITCAEAMDGGLWCWGENGKGQLGEAGRSNLLFETVAP
jgi:hypothetical protein